MSPSFREFTKKKTGDQQSQGPPRTEKETLKAEVVKAIASKVGTSKDAGFFWSKTLGAIFGKNNTDMDVVFFFQMDVFGGWYIHS